MNDGGHSRDRTRNRTWARHLGLIVAQLRLSVLAALEYRVGFWSDGVVGLAWSLGGLVPLIVALDHLPSVAGWSAWEVVLLTGFYLVFAGVFGAFLQPALGESMAHIRRGTLDYLLLRPVDALVSCLVAAFDPWSLLQVVAGVAMAAVALVELDARPGLVEIGMLALVLLAGLVSLYSLGVMILSLSFRALELQNLTFLMETALDFAHWPISVFRGPLKLLFTFVIPFGVMTSYPAQALTGALGAWPVVGGLASAAVLASLARLTWHRALRGYTSASS